MTSTKVITGKVRFSYAQVFTPKATEDGGKAKYSVSLLIPKSDTKTIAKIKAAIKAALEQGKDKFGGKIPKGWKNPLRDGDEEKDDEAYAGHYFVNAAAIRKPGIIDKDREDLLDPDEFYSGCYGRASVNFYAFNASGNKGIACGLNNLQKLEDGERLGAEVVSAQDDFADDFEDDDLL